MAEYKFSIKADTANDAVNPTTLLSAIYASGIKVSVAHVETGDDSLIVYFKDELSPEEEGILREIVKAHTGKMSEDAAEVGVIDDDSGDKRLQVQATLKEGHGLATEATMLRIEALLQKLIDK